MAQASRLCSAHAKAPYETRLRAAADAFYLTFDDSPPADTQELRPGNIADLNRMQLDLAC